MAKRLKWRRAIAGGALLFSVSATALAANTGLGGLLGPAAPAPVFGDWGVPLSTLDASVRPGDDFFEFANGGWLATAEIPPHRSRAGVLSSLRDTARAQVAEIIAELQTRPLAPGSDEQRIRDLYQSFVDLGRVEALGFSPIQADLDRIRRLKTRREIARVMADPALGLTGPFAAYVSVDRRAPDRRALWATQSGLGLSDRSYYLRGGARPDRIRTAYRAHIATMLGHAGVAEAERLAEAVFELEREMARVQWSGADRRNASRTYNPIPLDKLRTRAPGFPWADYLAAAGFGEADRVIVREWSAFPELAALFAETPAETWRAYLTFHYLTANAQYLPAEIDAADFAFFGGALKGLEARRDREERGVRFVDDRLEHAVGRLYAERYVSDEAKAEVEAMVGHIRAAFAARIETLDWMTEATRAEAQAKLANLEAKIAYPDVWRDYSGIEIDPGDLVGNVKRLRIASRARAVERLGAPVDRGEWSRGPQAVNAFYSPTRNEIFVPAGYIQPPLFDPNADAAVNYGAIGAIIGHEIAHAFDDQGSKYDATGALRNWWTDADRAAFDALADRLAAQFDAYEPLPGLHVNGRRTLGENIGDLVGATVAYEAYIRSLDGARAPVLDGYTGPQRFFLGRAQARRSKPTESALRRRVLTARHSPIHLRVNGLIRNMDAWYAAFDVSDADALYLPPVDRVRIW